MNLLEMQESISFFGEYIKIINFDYKFNLHDGIT